MKTRIIWLAALALLAALVISGTAFAEGEEPPAPPEGQNAPVKSAAVVDEALPPAEPVQIESPVELPAVEEPTISEEAALAEPAPVVEEVLVEPVPVETATVPTVEKPVLVDASGEPLVLASQ